MWVGLVMWPLLKDLVVGHRTFQEISLKPKESTLVLLPGSLIKGNSKSDHLGDDFFPMIISYFVSTTF